MIKQNWWFATSPVKQHKYCPLLNKSIKCDVGTPPKPDLRTTPSRHLKISWQS
jgi:hypothetical protein